MNEARIQYDGKLWLPKELMIFLHNKGHSLAEIAEVIDCSRENVRKTINKLKDAQTQQQIVFDGKTKKLTVIIPVIPSDYEPTSEELLKELKQCAYAGMKNLNLMRRSLSEQSNDLNDHFRFERDTLNTLLGYAKLMANSTKNN
ncbi:hypothetical protein ACFX5K_01295 [Rickettsiales bacterium LUAb2]